jgi:hypothetical protein
MNAEAAVKNRQGLRACGMLSAGLLMILLSLMSSYLDNSIFYMLEAGAVLVALLSTFDLAGWVTNEIVDRSHPSPLRISVEEKERIESRI